MSRSMLEELNLSSEEISRFGKAFQDDKFKQLFKDYVNEISDPANKKKYEEELAQLEREHGMDVEFIHPAPAYVLKTTGDGVKKVFINICTSDKVKPPQCQPCRTSNQRGLNWQIPYSNAKSTREDIDKSGAKCVVFDVVFHPDALYLTEKDMRMRGLIESTAMDAVEKTNSIVLDKKNVRRPKMKYKGSPTPTVIRKPISTTGAKSNLNDSTPEYSWPRPDNHNKLTNTKSDNTNSCNKGTDDEFTVPHYTMKYRSHVDLQEFTDHPSSNRLQPTEIIVAVDLPLLPTSATLDVDVMGTYLNVSCTTPAQYKLDLKLPYVVDDDRANAKFDKNTRQLTITMPIINTAPLTIEQPKSPLSPVHSCTDTDEEEEAEHSPPPSTLPVTVEKIKLDPHISYTVPPYSISQLGAKIVVNIHVENLDRASVKTAQLGSSIHFVFRSIGSGFVPYYYSFYGEFNTESYEVLDNCIQLVVGYSDNFSIGLTKQKASNYKVCELLKNLTLTDVTRSEKEEQTEDVFNCTDKVDETNKSENIDDVVDQKNDESSDEVKDRHSSGESNTSSSGGDVSMSRSKSRSLSESSVGRYPHGILKRCESSGDETMPSWSSSLDIDGTIAEESPKKTVRFSDVVARQLYRHNSSILGQRKKNQRKAMKKRRAADRRASDSDIDHHGTGSPVKRDDFRKVNTETVKPNQYHDEDKKKRRRKRKNSSNSSSQSEETIVENHSEKNVELTNNLIFDLDI